MTTIAQLCIVNGMVAHMSKTTMLPVNELLVEVNTTLKNMMNESDFDIVMNKTQFKKSLDWAWDTVADKYTIHCSSQLKSCEGTMTKRDISHWEKNKQQIREFRDDPEYDEPICRRCYHLEYETCEFNENNKHTQQKWDVCTSPHCNEVDWPGLLNRDFTQEDLYSLLMSSPSVSKNLGKNEYYDKKRRGEDVREVSPYKEHITTLCWEWGEGRMEEVGQEAFNKIYHELHDRIHKTEWESNLEAIQ